MKIRIYLICENAIRVISGGVLLFLVIMNFLFSSHVDYQSERVNIEKNGAWVVVITLILLSGFFIISCMAEKLDEKVVFVALTAFFVVAGVYLIANADGTLRADPLYVYQTAVELNKGDYSSFIKGGYIFYFPHQLGMETYERILLHFSSDTKFLFFCNLMEMIGINFFLWRITNFLFRSNHVANVNVIIFSFAFLPQFFFILFGYGLLPGFFCLMAAFFWAVDFMNNGKKKCLIVMTVFSCLAIFLKENYLIGIIALTIWLFLEFMKSKRYRLMIAVLLLIPCCVLSVRAVKSIYELENRIEMGKGVPAMLYINMGVNINNEMWGPGWFDGTNWSYFTECDQDSQAAEELAKNMLHMYWEQMCDEPFHAVKFFIKKNVSIWCEPMYQSVWSGPLESCGQYMNTRFFQSLYRGEEAEHITYQYMKGYVLVILCMSFLFLVKEWKRNSGVELLFLYNTGGFLFHTFWEGKSQYIYPYIFVLIPLCAYMLAKFSAYWSNGMECIRRMKKEKGNKQE